MTEIEIKEGNKKIAVFMGYTYFESGVLVDYSDCGGIYDSVDIYSKTPILVNDYGDGQKYFADVPNPDYKNNDNPKWNRDLETLSWATLNEYITELRYHDSWDWLMPVVEKIEKGNYGFKICRKVVEVYVDDSKETIIKTKEENKMNSLFKAVVEFIELLKE